MVVREIHVHSDEQSWDANSSCAVEEEAGPSDAVHLDRLSTSDPFESADSVCEGSCQDGVSCACCVGGMDCSSGSRTDREIPNIQDCFLGLS